MRERFELEPDLIYLNSGTHSLAPRSVLDAVRRHQAEYERNPTLGLFEAWGNLWRIHKEVARFLGARAEDLFFRSNVTASLGAFLMGIPLPSDGEILVSDLEYGAIVNICRYRADRGGLRLRAFHLPCSPSELAGLTREALAERVLSELKPDTRLVLLSHVMTGTGLRLPIREIAHETRRRGILLAVDGAHAAGALHLDFAELDDVDFYGGNFHKWMMGPKGTSFGWVPRRHHDALALTLPGWTTFETPKPFEPFGEGSRFALRMLMSACHDFAPFYALHEMLELWNGAPGAAAIRARLAELQAATLSAMAEATGWPCLTPADPELRGPLLAFELPMRLQPLGYSLMFELLRKHRLMISTAPLGGSFCLRLSPHVYNTEDELTRASRILRDL